MAAKDVGAGRRERRRRATRSTDATRVAGLDLTLLLLVPGAFVVLALVATAAPPPAGALSYLIQTSVPHNWIPFVPVSIDPARGEIALERAAMLDAGRSPPVPIRPIGRVLTPRAAKGYGMYAKAKELAEAHGWFLAHQFETPANADIHESTTAAEILADFEGQRLDYFVSGYGTGGTVAGVGRVLKKTWPDAKIILSEPANAQIVGSGIAQERNAEGEPTGGHPSFEPHPIQGWTPDFIPLVLQEAIDGGYYDELIPISGAEGMKWARELGAKEGILTGVSGGSTFGIAMQVAEKAAPGIGTLYARMAQARPSRVSAAIPLAARALLARCTESARARDPAPEGHPCPPRTRRGRHLLRQPAGP